MISTDDIEQIIKYLVKQLVLDKGVNYTTDFLFDLTIDIIEVEDA